MERVRRKGELIADTGGRFSCDVTLHVVLDDNGNEMEIDHSFDPPNVKPPLVDGTYTLTTADGVRRGEWRLAHHQWTKLDT